MRSTFKVLFYVKKGSEKPNGNLPLMCRLTVDGEIKQFSCAAPAQVNRRILKYVPPHCTLAGDHFRKARCRALRNGVLDIEPGIVVARDRNDAVRGTQASQQLPGAGVELRTADVHQVAAEDDQVGAKAVDAVHQAPQFRFGTHDSA